MENFEKQGGVSFFILFFYHRNEFYYLRFSLLKKFWERAKEGGRKSFRYEELESEYFLHNAKGILVPYLEALQKDLETR
jgi:recombination protein U